MGRRILHLPTFLIAGAALVAYSVVALMALSEQEAQAAYPGKNGKIAFVSGGTAGNWPKISTVEPDGSDRTLMTRKTHGEAPAWSPDGTRIVFVREVQPPPQAPYCRDSCFYYDVWVMDADGYGKTNLTPGDANNGSSPTWSPDGEKIAYASYVDDDGSNDCELIEGTPPGCEDGDYEIYVMDADGSDQTRLTDNERPTSDHDPRWSPDGRIYFSRSVGRNYVMDADGSDQTPAPWDGSDVYDYDFSPDGARIVFNRDGDIWTMDADGSNEARLTDDPAWDSGPAWSPDGKQIAFVRGGNLWVMDADGSDERVLAPDAWGQPDWQPNTAPAVTPRRPSPGSTTTDRTPRIAAKVGDTQTELAETDVRLFVDGQRVGGFSYDPTGDVLSYAPGERLSFGRHTVRVVSRDDVGLAGRGEWSFGVRRP